MSDELLLAYRPEGNTSRWLSYLIEREHSYPILYLVTVVALGAFWLFKESIFSLTPGLEKAIDNLWLMLSHPIWWLVFAPISFIVLKRLSRFLLQPTHLEVGAEGLKTYWRQMGDKSSRVVPWTSIENISVHQLPGSTLQDNALITFTGAKDKKLMQVRVGGLIEIDGKERFLSALNKYGKEVRRDYEVTALLSKPPDHTYTELWLNALSATPQRERLAPLAAGTKLQGGDYCIVDRIGMGGQGVAYRAIAAATEERDEIVAVLKEYVLPVHVTLQARKQSIEVLQHEAKLLQRLEHPQVVQLLDFFFEDHRGYLVLELIEGTSLRKIVENDGPLLESLVRDLALQMCDILEYLHQQTPPVVHRDFTPDNLILTTSGTLKLIDFNVAHQREATTTATVVGKHAFIPPEQFRGKPTPRSDIYAMGGTLHFLLTGQDPQPITPSHPQKINAFISSDIDDLIAKATSVDEKKRIQSAVDFRKALSPEAART
jgi:hypothetical protein